MLCQNVSDLFTFVIYNLYLRSFLFFSAEYNTCKWTSYVRAVTLSDLLFDFFLSFGQNIHNVTDIAVESPAYSYEHIH